MAKRKTSSSDKPGAAQHATELVPYDPGAVDQLLGGLHLGGGIKVKAVKAVTRPVLRQLDNVPIAVKIMTAIRAGEEFVRQSRAGEAVMKPADICFVVNLETGEEQTLVANAAMKSALERAYPGEGYVDHAFAMISHKRAHKEGKQIREYLIKELILE